MNVRIPCIRGYNEDQIAIVLDDPSMNSLQGNPGYQGE